ncbi:MAG TPA: 2-oxo-4-hydroxy-4-carboxy-5-ureidoimidazoline decarboxylase [Vicinamibacterales bacterium]|nr:2-oxo-4-hydroxy-4-carboxy-5-ureidoimidazoline decarboxylase [Vicinamibacterales bacterium]
MTRLTLDALNAADRKTFVSALAGVFEDSPWIVERTWLQRPFATLEHLHRAMTAEIDRAPRDEQLSLLRAHPDLGARETMSTQSMSEQSGAGLTRLGDSDLAKLRHLNAAYRQKFGFPFLFAVKGSSPRDVLTALEQRLAATSDTEFNEAVRQVHKIGRIRLQALIAT